MNLQKMQTFYVIGIAIRTTNQNQQAAKDIPALWHKFMTERVADKIPHKIDSAIYGIYTDYEDDHTKPYTTILGCKVENLDVIPEGMVGKIFEASIYRKYTAAGSLMQGIVYKKWEEIWNTDLNRTFTADFEVYDERAQNPENAVVDIFIAVSSISPIS